MKVIKFPQAASADRSAAASSTSKTSHSSPLIVLEKHCDWMRETNYSDASVESRLQYLKKFFKWCEEREVVRLGQFTPQVIELYQKHLFRYRIEKTGAALAFTTQRYHLSNIREFFRWCVRKKVLTRNPASDLDLPRVGRRLPKYILSVAEVEQIINSVDLDLPAGVRNRAILEAIYSSGLRRREVVRLKIEDLDFDRGTVMIRQGKGKKDRLIPIGSRALQWIEKYLVEVRPALVKDPDPGNLFLSREGRELSLSSINRFIREVIKSSGVAKSGNIHLFRHSMATLMLENGADVRFVQEMLGHENLSATQIYTHVAIQKLKEVHTQSHPGAENEKRKKKKDKKPLPAPDSES